VGGLISYKAGETDKDKQKESGIEGKTDLNSITMGGPYIPGKNGAIRKERNTYCQVSNTRLGLRLRFRVRVLSWD
jgi:hypothetical protein